MSEQDWTTVVLKPKKPSQNINNLSSKVFNRQNKTIINTNNTTKKFYDKDSSNPDIIPVMIDKTLSRQIQQARNSKGLTQSQLANAIHIPLSVIVDYEKGNCVRNGIYVDKIKRYLGIDKHTK
jgi:ribosome-binding protein aMBF1 (putative translation factor)